jgi:hypothetical protein
MNAFSTLVAAVTCVVVCSACGSDKPTPTGPTPTPTTLVTGTWTGTATRTGATLALRLALTESALGNSALVFGTYSSGDGATTGSVGGAVVGTEVSLMLTPSVPPSCGQPQPFPPGQVGLLLRLDGNRMTGDATFTLCGESVRGTATLSR